MLDLPFRLSRALARILNASEGFSRGDAAGQDPSDQESVKTSTDGGGIKVSTSVLNRLASEGSGAQLRSLSLSDPNNVTLQAGSPNSNAASHGAAAPGAKGSQIAHTHVANNGKAVSNEMLTQQEKNELLVILQRIDSSYSMAEIDYLLDGIASGEIKDISFRALRRILEAAREYGLDFVVASLQDEDGDMSLETPTPTPVLGAPSQSLTPPGDAGAISNSPQVSAEPDAPVQLSGHSTAGPSQQNGQDGHNEVSTAAPGTSSEEPSLGAPGSQTGTPPSAFEEHETINDEVENIQESIDDVESDLDDLGLEDDVLNDVKEELQVVEEELTDIQEELANVQEELGEVKEVIEEIRQIIRYIRRHVSDFRLSRSLQSDTLPHLRISKNSLLTNVFKEETNESERLDTKHLEERRAERKMYSERETLQDEMAALQWRNQAASESRLPGDNLRNPEAEAPDLT